MKKIEVWICEECGVKFDEKESCRKHEEEHCKVHEWEYWLDVDDLIRCCRKCQKREVKILTDEDHNRMHKWMWKKHETRSIYQKKTI